jgi:hypothetical protein
MSKKRKAQKKFEFNLNLNPPKKKKTEENQCPCLIHCRDSTSENVIKFSENSIKTVLKAAEIRKDEKVASTLHESVEKYSDLPYGYHRKCYQKYTHKRELQKLSVSKKTESTRVSRRNKERGGIKNFRSVKK